jgi:hypothetical protein
MPLNASEEIFEASAAVSLLKIVVETAPMLDESSAAKSTVVAAVPVAAAVAENVTLLIVDMVCL